MIKEVWGGLTNCAATGELQCASAHLYSGHIRQEDLTEWPGSGGKRWVMYFSVLKKSVCKLSLAAFGSLVVGGLNTSPNAFCFGVHSHR